MEIELEDGSTTKVEQSWIDKQLFNGTFDSIIEVVCLKCGEFIDAEPDAQKSFCYGCDEVVKVFNPLMSVGLI